MDECNIHVAISQPRLIIYITTLMNHDGTVHQKKEGKKKRIPKTILINPTITNDARLTPNKKNVCR